MQVVQITKTYPIFDTIKCPICGRYYVVSEPSCPLCRLEHKTIKENKNKVTMKRLVFDIVYRDKRWCTDLRKYDKFCEVMGEATKTEAIRRTVDLIELLQIDTGVPCQLMIHKKNGEFQSERTYPDITHGKKG
jgi:hypothetical protein